MSKTVLFTFDYELFLGNTSGNVPDCLISPTQQLLKQLKEYSFKAFFFVDTIYLLRLNEIAAQYKDAKEDYDAILKQLTGIVKAGHEIHLHLHGHWLDAIYYPDTNTWTLNERRYYSFGNLPEEKRTELFDKSVELIYTILYRAGVKQEVDAYRAGGWIIQPFSAFKEHFTKHGFKHDFSVMPGKYYFTDVCYYDFRQAPLKETYRFSNDICIPDKNGEFREWTISACPLSSFERWKYFRVNSVYTRLFKPHKISGTIYNPMVHNQGDIYVTNGSRRVASFEEMNPYMVWHYLNLIKKNDYFHFISHPKLLFRPESLMISLLFKYIKRIGNIETCFRKSKYMEDN